MAAESNVSVIVVSYNTLEQLRKCLMAVEPEHELIVVDNASRDGSPEMVRDEFPRARLIVNRENRGFGAANNQGLDVATKPLKLLLNSDCYAGPGSIARLAELFENERIVAAGGALYNPDGSPQLSAANRLTLWAVFCEQTGLERVLHAYWVSDRIRKASPVAQVMGACLMFRTEDRFDERFFLYCEDTDLCVRIRESGDIIYDPSTSFIHELGASSIGEARWLSVARYNRGKELYFSIHHGSFAALLCLLLDRMGAAGRLFAYACLSVGSRRYRTHARLWWRVLKVSRLGPDRPPRKGG